MTGYFSHAASPLIYICIDSEIGNQFCDILCIKQIDNNLQYNCLILWYNCNGNCLFCLRKKYVKRMQIRHTYGDDEAEDDMCEESALQITEAAVSVGRAPAAPVIQEFASPEGAVVTLVAERSHRKNRSNSYIITKKSEKNYYLKKIN